jgi:hypothetical protein
VTDLNIPVLVTWQYQDGHIGGPISCSSYTEALKIIGSMKAAQASLAPIDNYWIESNAPELMIKQWL